jgi:alkylation response protein AidB-like acyl-CoA dehydrogenase
MRAALPPADVAVIAAQIEAAPGMARVRALNDEFAGATPETVEAILAEAAKFAADTIGGMNDAGDAQGCSLHDGRVRTAPGHKAAWDAYVEQGWPTLDMPAQHGGQGLPLALGTSVQSLLDRACPAFAMFSVPQRSAARLIAAFGTADMREEWLPHLVRGDFGATICISEAEAGSDVMRLRTRAEPAGDGTWRITGEKTWISSGDHDLTPRIGHCLLARTPGTAGLSLFLVPDHTDGRRNSVHVRRLEKKLGLHASPTCALGFEAATGRLIGQEGRGLQQMFVMITQMRLATASQGLGIASAASDIARLYAAERRQGGPLNAPAVPIEQHADVARMLLGLVSRVEILRGLILAGANQIDIAAHDPNPDSRAEASSLAQFLLPIIKTAGGEIAIENASEAIQVLGGAGYTREWPAEQALRDARILTIFEGTTGIQALDLLHRRLWRGDRGGITLFLQAARAAQNECAAPEAPNFARCLDLFEDAAARLLAFADAPRDGEAGATAFLHLAMLATTGWIAARLANLPKDNSVGRHLAASGRFWLSDIAERADLLHAAATAGGGVLELLKDIRR